MAHTQQIELYIVFNENGECAADMIEEQARERLVDEYGGNYIRALRVNLTVPTLAATEINVTVLSEGTPTFRVA